VLAAFFAIMWFAAPFRAESATQAVTVNTTNTLTTPFLPSALSATQVGNSPAWKDREKVLGLTTFTEGLEVLTPAAAVDLDFNTARTKRITLAQDTVLTCVNIPTASTNIETMLVEVIGDGIYTVIFTNTTFQTPTIDTPPAGVVTFYGIRADSGVVRGYCDQFSSSASSYLIGPLTPTYIPVASSTTNVTDSIMHQPGGIAVEDIRATSGTNIVLYVTTSQVQTNGDKLLSIGNFGSERLSLDAIGTIVQTGSGDAQYYQFDGSGASINYGIQAGFTFFQINDAGNTARVKFYPDLGDGGGTPHELDTSYTQTSGNILEVGNNGTLELTVAAGSGYTGAGTKFLSDDGTYKTSTFTNVADEVWINQAGVVSLVPGNTNFVVNLLSQSPDNATNVVLHLDTTSEMTERDESRLITGANFGTNTFLVDVNGGIWTGRDAYDEYEAEEASPGAFLVGRRSASDGDVGAGWALDWGGSANHDIFTNSSRYFVIGNTNLLSWHLDKSDAAGTLRSIQHYLTDNTGLLGNLYTRWTFNGVTVADINPTAPNNGTTPYIFDTVTNHTSGNLIEVANMGTNIMTLGVGLSGVNSALAINSPGQGGAEVYSGSVAMLRAISPANAAEINDGTSGVRLFASKLFPVTPSNISLGDSFYPWQDLFLNRNVVWNGVTNTLFDTWGSGTPESVVTARPGSIYRDTANGEIYKKSTGTGNTGWTAIGAGASTNDVVWLNTAGVVALDPGNTNYVVNIVSQSPDNATNVVLVVDTDSTWTTGHLMEVSNNGTNLYAFQADPTNPRLLINDIGGVNTAQVGLGSGTAFLSGSAGLQLTGASGSLLLSTTTLLPGSSNTISMGSSSYPFKEVVTGALVMNPRTVTYASSITVDFSGKQNLWTVLGGDVTLASSNLSDGRGITYRIDNQTATNCNVILPSGWRFVSGVVTNILAASKIGLLSALSYSTTDTNVVATWSSE